MNKVLIIDEHNRNAQMMAEFIQEELGTPSFCANSVESALEQFMEVRPTVLILEIVMPNSKNAKELHDSIEARQHQIMEVQEKLKDARPYRENADKMRVMDVVWGHNFLAQSQILNFSGGLVLLKLIKEYCTSEKILMPKVLFYTTQSVYEHLQTLSEIFDDERNYIWLTKGVYVEKVLDAFRELTAIEAEVV